MNECDLTVRRSCTVCFPQQSKDLLWCLTMPINNSYYCQRIVFRILDFPESSLTSASTHHEWRPQHFLSPAGEEPCWWWSECLSGQQVTDGRLNLFPFNPNRRHVVIPQNWLLPSSPSERRAPACCDAGEQFLHPPLLSPQVSATSVSALADRWQHDLIIRLPESRDECLAAFSFAV